MDHSTRLLLTFVSWALFFLSGFIAGRVLK
jgi:hypothetical protein